MPKKRAVANTVAESDSGLGREELDVSPRTSGSFQQVMISVVDQSLRNFADRAAEADKDATPTVAEVIRLLQLRRELEEEEPIREIEVRWVDASATES